MRPAVMDRGQRFATASGRGGAADWKKANNKPDVADRAHRDRAKLAADRWPPNAWSRGRLDKGGRVREGETMRLQAFRLGLAALMLCGGLLWPTAAAQAQDQASLANAANNAMKAVSNDLAAALAAANESTAKGGVRAAISAGQEAITALQTLRNTATNDLVRSRSAAALAQTTSAVNKAQAVLGQSGDAFRSGVQSALAEVNEAIGEFALVLQLVGQAPKTTVAAATAVAPRALPPAGEGDLTAPTLAGLGVVGLSMLVAGAMLRRRFVSAA